MISEMIITAALRDLVYLAIGATAFALLLRWIIELLGFPYAKITERLDDEPLAIAILFAGLAVSLALLVSGILH